MGGSELVRDFLKADLVDEFYPGIVPVLPREGRSYYETNPSLYYETNPSPA